MRLERAQADWQRKAELAITRGREDLARGALMEKAKLAETAKMIEEELPHLEDTLVKHEQDIAKLEEKLREVKAKQKLIQARHQSVASRLKVRQRVYDSRI
jgi:phage shock protein A